MADDNVLTVSTPARHDTTDQISHLTGTRDKGVDIIRQLCGKLKQAGNQTRRRKETLEEGLRQISELDLGADTDTESDESVAGEVKELAERLYHCARIRHFKGREDVGYVASDFDGAAEVGLIGMQCYYALLSKLPLDACTTSKRRRCDGDSVFDCLVLYAFLLCAEHLEPALWTSDVSVSTAQKLLRKLLDMCNVSVEELLCGSGGRQALFKKVLSFHLPHFTKNHWKERPSMKHVLHWCLLRVGFPHLSDYLDQVLPPSLLLVDDHEASNQVLGVRCLTHIVDNVSKSELSWFGRVDVIYDCLQKLTYSHASDVIDVLHPCLLKVLAAIEMKSKFSDEPRIVTRYDETFQRLLYDMEMETTLDARRAYSRHVSAYVTVMGISAVKHFDQLFRVIFSYLEVCDGSHEETRLNMLDVLRTTILTCWPRIPRRSEDIMKCLIKLLYCTVTDKTATETGVKDDLIRRTVDCLLLVKKLCPERTVAALNVVRDVGLGPECMLYIDQVLNTE